MTRAALVAIALVFLPPSCAKMLGQKTDPEPLITDPTPQPVPVTSATTPPVFTVDQGPPPPPASSGPPSDLQQAQAAADAKNYEKVKTILEKKTRSGKSSDAEAKLCLDACTQTKDKKCVQAIKSKYPSLVQ